MSKPNRGEIEFSGGYNEEKGSYVEGKVSLSWELGESPKSSSDSKESNESTNEPDSTDRK